MSIKDFQNFIASDPQLQNSPFGPCVRVVNLLHLHDTGIPYGFAPMQVAFAAAAQRRQIPLGRDLPVPEREGPLPVVRAVPAQGQDGGLAQALGGQEA